MVGSLSIHKNKGLAAARSAVPTHALLLVFGSSSLPRPARRTLSRPIGRGRRLLPLASFPIVCLHEQGARRGAETGAAKRVHAGATSRLAAGHDTYDAFFLSTTGSQS